MIDTAVVNNGLDGIIVAETKISEVDGQRGKLIICGRDAEELAFNSSLEQTCALLWSDESSASANASEHATWQKRFGQARLEAFDLLKKHPILLSQQNPMDALRSATSFLPGQENKANQSNKRSESDGPDDSADFINITAALAVFVSNWSRVEKGLALCPPDPDLTIAADFLRTIRGEAASQAEIQALDTYLTTVSDHGMNASTFAARVVASTESDNISCVVAAIGALKGPLHGGAPGPVLEMLDAIGRPENAESWLVNAVNSGKRIMGMGHRIYRVRDPRAAIFERAITSLEESGSPATRLPLARAVESAAGDLLAKLHPDRPLKANVEFYTAVLLDALRIPHNLFTATFAAGRVAGWCAHIKEQRANGRLIRPGSKYVGQYPITAMREMTEASISAN
jgi:citrate synthase